MLDLNVIKRMSVAKIVEMKDSMSPADIKEASKLQPVLKEQNPDIIKNMIAIDEIREKSSALRETWVEIRNKRIELKQKADKLINQNDLIKKFGSLEKAKKALKDL